MKKLEGSSGKSVAERVKPGPRKERRPRMLKRANKAMRKGLKKMWAEMQRRYANGNPQWYAVRFPVIEQREERRREEL